MKTETKKQLIEIIKKKGEIRPFDLAKLLHISPQAVHRHLRSLVSEGVLERRGKPPSTRYTLTDIPNFKSALRWFGSKKAANPPIVCETRDIFAGRLNQLLPLALPQNELSLLISASGEVGNNSFDHNMGQWKDIPGCWFETQATRHRHWVLIADRGQGIYRSLSRVIPNISDEESAMKKAFEERLSGRAPEKRGNGLKFVRELITESPDRGIACRSGRGSIYYGKVGKDCFNVLHLVPDQDFGTVTLMTWPLK